MEQSSKVLANIATGRVFVKANRQFFQRLRRLVGLSALALVGLVVASSCQEPTQVTFVISSPELACEKLRGVEIVVSASPDRAEDAVKRSFITTGSTNCDAPRSTELGTLVATPGPDGRVAIIVIAGVSAEAKSCRPETGYRGCIVARRSLAFIKHTRLVVKIDLQLSCLDVPCDVVTTCARGSCISSEVDCADDGSCISKDDPTKNDGSVPPAGDARTDGPLLEDGSSSGDATPNDGSSSDASGGDGSVGALCTPICSGAAGACTPNEVCCRVQQQGFSTCVNPPSQCELGGGSRAPGVAVCCRVTAECPANSVCCLTMTNAQPAPLRGSTICTTAPCNAANQRVLCSGSGECLGRNQACMTLIEDSYFNACY